MNVEEFLLKDFLDKITEQEKGLTDLIDSSENSIVLYYSLGAFPLLRLLTYYKAGAFNIDEADIMYDYIDQLIYLLVLAKYGSDQQAEYGSDQQIAKNQLKLVARALNPDLYNLKDKDLDKAIKALTKKTEAFKAQAIRIRRMMVFLSHGVEPIDGAKSILREEVQLITNPTIKEKRIFNRAKGKEDKSVEHSILPEGYFLKENPYWLAKKAFNHIEKEKAYLEDLAIVALQLKFVSFRGKEPRYFKDRLRQFEQWEKSNIPIWARSENKEVTQQDGKSMFFELRPYVLKVGGKKPDEYIVLYYFNEDWKLRDPGSGGSRIKTQK